MHGPSKQMPNPFNTSFSLISAHPLFQTAIKQIILCYILSLKKDTNSALTPIPLYNFCAKMRLKYQYSQFRSYSLLLRGYQHNCYPATVMVEINVSMDFFLALYSKLRELFSFIVKVPISNSKLLS